MVPLEAPAQTRSCVGLQVTDSSECGRDTRRHTCPCNTSYRTRVRSKEQLSTRRVVSVSKRTQSLTGSVCELHVLCNISTAIVLRTFVYRPNNLNRNLPEWCHRLSPDVFVAFREVQYLMHLPGPASAVLGDRN